MWIRRRQDDPYVDENEIMLLSCYINYDSKFTRVRGEIIIFGPG